MSPSPVPPMIINRVHGSIPGTVSISPSPSFLLPSPHFSLQPHTQRNREVGSMQRGLGNRRPSKPLAPSAPKSPQKFRPRGKQEVDELLRQPDVLDRETRRAIVQDVMGGGARLPAASSANVGPTSTEGSGEIGAFPSQLRERVRAGSGSGGGGGSDELLTVMTARLRDLESRHKAYQEELKEMHTKYQRVTDELERERHMREEAETAVLTLYDEKELLEAQLHSLIKEMESPYGNPKTVEHRPANESNRAHGSPISPSGAAQVKNGKPFDLFSGDYVDGESPPLSPRSLEAQKKNGSPVHFVNTAEPGKPLYSPRKESGVGTGPPSIAKSNRCNQGAPPQCDALPVDPELLKKNARILSDYVGWKGVVRDGQKGGLRERDVVRVVLYKNGICVNSGPFRPYGWALCDAFIDDLAEGFYPYEYKEKYPDGYPIEVVDRTKEECDVSGGRAASPAAGRANVSDPSSGGRRLGGNVHSLHDAEQGGYTPISREEFLKKMPAQKVTKSGQLVNVRDDVAALMGEKRNAPVALNTVRHVSSAEADYRLGCGANQNSAGTKSTPVANHEAAMIIGDLVALLIRLPDGRKITFHMNPTDTIAAVRAEFMKAVPEFRENTFELCQAFPYARTLAEHHRTLTSLGIVKSCALMVRKNKSA